MERTIMQLVGSAIEDQITRGTITAADGTRLVSTTSNTGSLTVTARDADGKAKVFVIQCNELSHSPLRVEAGLAEGQSGPAPLGDCVPETTETDAPVAAAAIDAVTPEVGKEEPADPMDQEAERAPGYPGGQPVSDCDSPNRPVGGTITAPDADKVSATDRDSGG